MTTVLRFVKVPIIGYPWANELRRAPGVINSYEDAMVILRFFASTEASNNSSFCFEITLALLARPLNCPNLPNFSLLNRAYSRSSLSSWLMTNELSDLDSSEEEISFS